MSLNPATWTPNEQAGTVGFAFLIIMVLLALLSRFLEDTY